MWLLALLLVVDTSEWTGTGSTNGWRYSGLYAPYTDGAAQFNGKGDSIESPQFDEDIVEVEVDPRSSLNPSRKLELFAYRSDEVVETHVLTPTPTGRSYGFQTFRFHRTNHIDRVSLILSAGASGNWGVYTVRLRTVAATEAAPPYDLAVARIRANSFTATWCDADLAVANTVRVYSLVPRPASGTAIFTETFASLTNATGNPKSIIAALPSRFSGERLYLPANTNGVLQISSRDDPGYLAFDVPAADADLTLALTAQLMDEREFMPIDCVADGKTNHLASLELADSMRTYTLPLAAMPDNAQLIFHSATNSSPAKRSNGRILVDAISLIRDYSAPSVSTTLVRRVASVAQRARVDGLSGNVRHAWSVVTHTAVGESDEVWGDDFTTLTNRVGFECFVK